MTRLCCAALAVMVLAAVAPAQGVRARLQGPEEVAPPPRPADPVPVAPLWVGEVLDAVEAFYPLLLAAEQERAIAAGRVLTAQGVFDLNFKLGEIWQQGSYDSHRLDLGFEQASPLLGASVFGGYRIAGGSFPVYYGERVTAQGGEFRAGLAVPLLRDRAIDRRRAGIQQAEINRLLADPLVQRARIDFVRNASRAYWNWVAAGLKYRVAEQLRRTAVERNLGLEELVRAGKLAAIEAVDNRRVIEERNARLVVAERRLQQTAIELSLYYRDAGGQPLLPKYARLPAGFPEMRQPALERYPQDLEVAFGTRPELRRFQLLRDRTRVDLKLAENQMLPGVGAVFSGAQDVGEGSKTLDRATYTAAVVVDVPLQRRDAQGRILSAQATLTQLSAQERYQRDSIAAELQDAVSALDRAYSLSGRLDEVVRLAKTVEDGEREKLREGKSNILTVNLRELARFDAESAAVDALLEYFRAHADYRAALGLDAATEGKR